MHMDDHIIASWGDIHSNTGPQTHCGFVTFVFKPITKHQTTILCNRI